MDIFDLIFPRKCFGCTRQGEYLCDNCLVKLQTKGQKCPVCKKKSIDGLTHSRCLRKLSLNGHYSLWEYKGAVRKALLTLKYRFAFDIARELADKASKRLTGGKIFSTKLTLVPIPTHPIRRNWRGFNQSEEIGKATSKNMGWCYEANLLFKITKTRPQTELKKALRLKNLKKAFFVNPVIKLSENTPLILFDDVWTTGSTLKEACKVLKRAGYKNVWGLTLARTF